MSLFTSISKNNLGVAVEKEFNAVEIFFKHKSW